MDPRHVTRSYIFIGGENRPTTHFLTMLFWFGEQYFTGSLQQPLFKIRIAESLQIDFFGAPTWGGNERPAATVGVDGFHYNYIFPAPELAV